MSKDEFVQRTVSLTPDLCEWLDRKAAEQERSFSAEVRIRLKKARADEEKSRR